MSPRLACDALKRGDSDICLRCLNNKGIRHSGYSKNDALRANHDCQPGRQNLERGFMGRIAHQDIGDSQADTIKRTGNRDAEALIALAPAILKRRSHTRVDDAERGGHGPSLHAGVQPSAASRWISPASLASTGLKQTRSPAWKRGSFRRFRSQGMMGVYPMICQPPGLSSG